MVFMPPRHGKSELTSRRLPAFIHGRNPDARIIGASYAASLAVAMCRDVQRIIDTAEYGRIFSGTRLSGKHPADSSLGTYRRTSDVYEVVGHSGAYYAAGVGGGITGKGFDYGIIDDPIKGAEEADSPVIREKIWDWYNNDFMTRQQSGASILITMTRWHREDLAGRLLTQAASDPRADQWDVVSFPAQKVDDSNPDDPRQIGESLWPEQYGPDYLDKIKAHPRTWQALYQQNPTAEGGSEWPDWCFDGGIWCNELPSNTTFRAVAFDPSKGRDAKKSDYSAIVGIGVTDDLVYVEADLERRNPTMIVEDLFMFCERFRPDAVGFEANAFQELFAPIIDHTARDPRFANTYLAKQLSIGQGLYLLQNTVKKEVRIRRLSENIVQKKFRFVRSLGTQLLVDQLRDFPNGSHDDGPDALEMACRLPVEIAGL